MPSDEFSEAMTITAISFQPAPGFGDQVNFDAFYMDMGYCAADQLDPVFESNYISGSKIRVFERTSTFTVNAAYPWTAITLDTPFFYDPAVGNLVFEIQWPDGNAQIYSFDFATAGTTLITAGYGEGSGNPFTQAPHILLEGDSAFDQTTFAAIKATFD